MNLISLLPVKAEAIVLLIQQLALIPDAILSASCWSALIRAAMADVCEPLSLEEAIKDKYCDAGDEGEASDARNRLEEVAVSYRPGWLRGSACAASCCCDHAEQVPLLPRHCM